MPNSVRLRRLAVWLGASGHREMADAAVRAAVEIEERDVSADSASATAVLPPQ